MTSHDPKCCFVGKGEEAPAVYHNGVVPSPSLHLVQLFDDLSDGGKVSTHPIR